MTEWLKTDREIRHADMATAEFAWITRVYDMAYGISEALHGAFRRKADVCTYLAIIMLKDTWYYS